MEYRLTTPCTAQDLAPLKAGDTVLLSGVVYTARDQAHKRMMEALDKGETLPFDLEGSAIYYVGPTPERPGEVIGSAGPTTSGRMDAMSPRLLDLGNKIMIGKGKRDAAVAGDHRIMEHSAAIRRMTGERTATSPQPIPLRSFSLERTVAAALAIIPAVTAISDHPLCQTAFPCRRGRVPPADIARCRTCTGRRRAGET